ncbi:DNA-binding protein [Aphanothece hegewaldii CCALA 016]|uniref:DNA-binding protein n=1 Tax=Aphanothece hegewaldii CCALA 016 TaxID=2107694 RepID=A0A2T1LRA8_9CHRO|nr:DNA-binding protein [Aphanothece hegewaldii]PSF30605.1 DNA-binding protein [Aphanothece hegewaldii CCALA 016]
MTLALTHPMTIKPEDFEPPLKRKEAAVPSYWTVEELAEELDVSMRKVLYDITGNAKLRVRPKLKIFYKLGANYLIPEVEAIEYLWNQRQARKKINKI